MPANAFFILLISIIVSTSYAKYLIRGSGVEHRVLPGNLRGSVTAQCWSEIGNGKQLCLDNWEIGNGNATFTLTCVPDAGDDLQWCGIGFNIQYPAPTRWGMAPSEIIMLKVLTSGKIVLEDRTAPVAQLPPCFKKQLTTLIKATLNNDKSVTATFTRPVFLTDDFLALGYTNLNRTVPMVAAMNTGNPRFSTAYCDDAINYHTYQDNSLAIAFL
jgi:hypothetical protein